MSEGDDTSVSLEIHETFDEDDVIGRGEFLSQGGDEGYESDQKYWDRSDSAVQVKVLKENTQVDDTEQDQGQENSQDLHWRELVNRNQEVAVLVGLELFLRRF